MLLSAAGLGATFSALWLAHGGAARIDSNRVLWSSLAFAMTTAALMFTDRLIVASVVMVAFGFAGEAARTGTLSILQISVDDAQRGRLMSTQIMLTRVAGGVGMLLIGIAAGENGLRLPMLIAVMLALVAWCVAFVYRKRIRASFD